MVEREQGNHYENVSLRVRKTSEIKSDASTRLELIDCVKVSTHISFSEMNKCEMEKCEIEKCELFLIKILN